MVLVIMSLLVRGLVASTETAPLENPHDYFKEALTAHEQKDYVTFVKDMEMALKLRPTHQVYLYDLAGGYALVGKKAEALSLLSEAGRMGLTYPRAERDPDFAGLRDSKEFASVCRQFEENQKPIVHSETAFIIPEKGLVPEGLAYDSETKTFYIGSVYRRKIIAINAAAKIREFSGTADGLWSVMGMKVDKRRHQLWVCTAGHLQMENPKPGDDGRSGVFAYDLTTGKLSKKYLIPSDGKKHWLGDLVLDSRGNVYASDSLSPAIYVIRSGNDRIEPLCSGEPFLNPQGLAMTPDEQHLVMADYLKGLFLIDLKTTEIAELTVPPHVTLLGIDGTYSARNGIVCVQNGITPNRIVRLRMDNGWRKITNFEVLEANNPLFDEPTLGTMVNNEFYFIANSQWAAIDPKGQLAPAEKLRDPIILKLRLL